MSDNTEITLARNTLRQIFLVDEEGNELLKLALHIDSMKEKIEGNANLIPSAVGRLNFFMELNHLFEPYSEKCRDHFTDQLPWEQNDEYVEEVFELGRWIKEQENEVRTSRAKKVRKEPMKLVSFERTHDNSKVDNLQDALDSLKGKFVDDKCTLPQFRKIFRDVESYNRKKSVGTVAESFNKVRWKGTVAELKYFINRLIETDKIDDVKSKWVTTVHCFECCSNDGTPISEQMFRSNTTPPKSERAKLLDRAVDYF